MNVERMDTSEWGAGVAVLSEGERSGREERVNHARRRHNPTPAAPGTQQPSRSCPAAALPDRRGGPKETRSPESGKNCFARAHTLPHGWYSPHIRISKRLKALPLAVVLVLLFLREKE